MPPLCRCVLSCLLFAQVAVGSGAGTVAHPLTLGLVAPATEPDATSLRRGAAIAVAQANRTGAGPVRLVVRSQTGQWGSVGNQAVALIFGNQAGGIIAPADGSASHLILQVASRTRVPVVSLCPDASVTKAGVPWATRVVPRTDEAARLLFTAIRRPRGPLRWWALVPAGRPGREARHDLETAAQSTGTRLDRVMTWRDPRTNLGDLLGRTKSQAPEGLLLWLPPGRAGHAAAALRAAGYEGFLAGPCWLASPAFVAAAGQAASGVLMPGLRPTPDLRATRLRFEAAYRRSFGAPPDFSAQAAHDAARLLIEALRRTHGADAYRLFPLSFTITGVTGPLRFDASGNRLDALQLLTCQQGRFIPLMQSKP